MHKCKAFPHQKKNSFGSKYLRILHQQLHIHTTLQNIVGIIQKFSELKNWKWSFSSVYNLWPFKQPIWNVAPKSERNNTTIPCKSFHQQHRIYIHISFTAAWNFRIIFIVYMEIVLCFFLSIYIFFSRSNGTFHFPSTPNASSYHFVGK